MADVLTSWLDLCRHVAGTQALCYSGVRKIVEDQSLVLTTLDSDLQYEDICYTKAKGAQLQRNYWNQASVDAAIQKLKDRVGKDHSSVSIQLQGQEKDSRSQGFCMQNLVITVTKQKTTVDIYYRSTELIQKFLADLIFFRTKLPPLFDQLGRQPAEYRFKFANVYLSAMFMPIYLRYEDKPYMFFKVLEKLDPKFYRSCGMSTQRYFNASHNYTYRTRVKMFEYWKEHVDEAKLGRLELLLNKLREK